MIRVLIVDDDALIHVTLRTIVNWEKLGYTVVQDCSNGNQVLSYLKNHTIDLLITDMKMPAMGGLDLMRVLLQQGRLPVTIALSGYDEFELVREAFRLGAYDYLLKADINPAGLERLLRTMKEKLFHRIRGQEGQLSQPELPAASGVYMVAAFQIQEFTRVAQRFGDNLRDRLEKPMLELVNQIQRLQGRAELHALGPDYIELYYPVRDKKRAADTMLSVVRQVQGVWLDFLNVETAVGISDPTDSSDLAGGSRTAGALAALAVLQGRRGICPQWEFREAEACYQSSAQDCDSLIAALCAEDNEAAQREIGQWFSRRKQQSDQQSRLEMLVLLARLGQKLRSVGRDFYDIFPERTDFFAASKALATRQERVLWLRSLLRRVQEACAAERQSRQLGPMERARRFMQDNFSNPELSLGTVAEYVGFNEKYFSTRFAKECGCTFIAYLNDLRIRRAQELLVQTDMKMYEISEAVGYGSVEHFNHIFKKKLCISPKEYRQSQK